MTALAKRFPNVPIILDHLGRPVVTDGPPYTAAQSLFDLAPVANIYLKLTPRIMGDKVGLHPMVVMVSLIVGGNLLGVWGMLVAIPITATLSVVLSEWIRGYRASRVFGDIPTA